MSKLGLAPRNSCLSWDHCPQKIPVTFCFISSWDFLINLEHHFLRNISEGNILKEMPCGSRLCWLDSSGYIHSKISYMVSSLRGKRGEGGKERD